jgi:RHS repeat-associated protein
MYRIILSAILIIIAGVINYPLHAACLSEPGNPGTSTSCGAAASNSISTQGNTSEVSSASSNPINAINGNKYQEEIDMPALPGEFGLELVRHYNSSLHAFGYTGYGWRLSYETDLFADEHTIQINQADGYRIIFTRDRKDPTICTPNDPARGTIVINKTAKGEEYIWIWANGRSLYFNHMGKLERITSASGQTMHFYRGLKGELIRVTDPQGRSMTFEYASKKSKGFRGIIAVNTPVGRYEYQHNDDKKSAGFGNLMSVKYPQEKIGTHGQNEEERKIFNNVNHVERHYHYGEITEVAENKNSLPNEQQAAHFLTGITVNWQDAEGKAQQQRINTWGYNAQGRAMFSVLGPYDPTAKKAGPGQLTLRFSNPDQYTEKDTQKQDLSKPQTPHGHHQHEHKSLVNTTILIDGLGQQTIVKHTVIAGQYRLIEVTGVGCSSCPENNMQYRYDNLARLVDKIKLKPDGKPLYIIRKSFDKASRVKEISRIDYDNDKALPAQLLRRFEYPVLAQDKADFIQKAKGYEAAKLIQQTYAVYNQPNLIAMPSVVKGKEHQWRIIYNQYGQPKQITETGYRPALPTHNTKAPTLISRTRSYQYKQIDGKNLLAQIDGPLPNGKTNTPQDSDVTQYQYDELGRYLTKITAPNNITTKLVYDLQGDNAATGGTGRVVTSIAHNGLLTRYTYNNAGKVVATQRYPSALNDAQARTDGLLQSTAMAYDVFGHTTMVQRADGQAVFMQYSKDGKLTELKDGLGNRVEWKDWNKGQHKQGETVTTQQWYTTDAPNSVDRAWYFWHDEQQRLTQRLSPDGGLDTWRYSNSQTSDIDQTLPAEAANDQSWVQHIDPLNRMTLSIANSQNSAQVRMTSAGYMDAILSLNAYAVNTTQTNSQATHQTSNQPVQEVDDFGRVVLFRSPQHGTHIAQYNVVNGITQIQQPDGTQIRYTYDVAGRIISKSAQATQTKTMDVVAYSYNTFGLNQVKDSAQTITYTKDLLGRELDKATTISLQNGQQKTYHIRTRYDAQGHIHAKQLIDGQWLAFTLDNKTGLTKAMTIHKTIWPSLTNKLADWLNLPNLPLQIATKETVVTDITVHPFNGITHLTHGNGISDDYGFDLAGRLTTVSHVNPPQKNKANSPFIQASYTYDAGRRLVSEKIDTANLQGKVKAYAYTGWNQLATPPKAGFMHAVANHAATNNTANNAMAKSEQTAQDQAGRTTSDAQYRYSYNVWGKLTNVQKKNTNTIVASYQNNALGERVMASYPTAENTQTRYYLYDHQQRVAELDDNGQVLQQNLYVNQSLVAVINTPIASNDHSEEGIIAIHTDRRNAPVAATDEQGKVIWQAEYDAWGKVIPVSNIQQKYQNHSFNISLRLPGQWQDQATGLYYNYQRDYNPSTGKYLTPDPLGFPDGADPYAYVNNDPLNKLDPLGLYEIDIHYYMTFFLAVTAGVPADQARIIALATQYIDDNPITQPLPHDLTVAAWNIAINNQAVVTRLLSYHFTPTPSIIGADGLAHPVLIDDPNDPYGIAKIAKTATTSSAYNHIPDNPQLVRLYDAVSTAKCSGLGINTQLQFFGEYLHAFEDTFGHRDSNNVPIDANGGFGHGIYGHNPDYTYDHWAIGGIGGTNWDNNETRTLEMEKEVFAKMAEFADPKKNVVLNGTVSETAFYAVLKAFNSINENNGNTSEFGDDKGNPLTGSGKAIAESLKLQMLQNALKNMGFDINLIYPNAPNFMGYIKQLGKTNRIDNLCVNGMHLKQTDYSGTILPATCLN